MREEREAGWVTDTELGENDSKVSKTGNSLYLIQTRRSHESLQVFKINYLTRGNVYYPKLIMIYFNRTLTMQLINIMHNYRLNLF